MNLWLGAPVAENIKKSLIESNVKGLRLRVLSDMGHEPNRIYVSRKLKFCLSLGIEVEIVDLATTAPDEAKILATGEGVDGVLVQLPIPGKHSGLTNMVPPHRDVEGFHPFHLGRGLHGQFEEVVVPCTAAACVSILDHYAFDLSGTHVVIVNDSVVLGRPLAAALLRRNATVTICNQYTKDIGSIVKISDLLVTGVGRKEFEINPEWICDRISVIDVGIRSQDGKVMGDLGPQAAERCRAYTPVPGGVGPVTVAWVANNLSKLVSMK